MSVWSNFKLLSVVNPNEKDQMILGNLIDNQRSLKFCIKLPGLLKDLWENADCTFLI